MGQFTPGSALFGGAIIAVALGALLLLTGRLGGVSGIVGGILRGTRGDLDWRAAFVGGMVVGGFVLGRLMPSAFESGHRAPLGLLVFAGVCVGVGTRMANGCTSGHGLCGLSRMSRRSIAATLTFMAVAMVTVLVVYHLVGAGA